MAIQINGVDSPVTQAWADTQQISGKDSVVPCFTIDPRWEGEFIFMGLEWANKPIITGFGTHAHTFTLHPQSAQDNPSPLPPLDADQVP